MINKDTLIKTFITAGYAAFMLYMLMTDKIAMYVHPKMNQYVLACALLLIVIALVISKDLFSHTHSHKGLGFYSIFLIPLLLGFFIQPVSLASVVAQSRGVTINKKVANSTGILSKQNDTVVIQEVDKKEYEMKISGDEIIVTDRNYMDTVDKLFIDTEKYENKTIELIGFVFRDKDFNDTRFVAARSLISCCAADATIVGLICEYSHGKQLKNDTWIKVKGKIKDTSFNGQQMPMIVVEKCEEIEKPKNEYIYP